MMGNKGWNRIYYYIPNKMHNQTATDEEKLQEEEASQSISSMPKKLKITRFRFVPIISSNLTRSELPLAMAQILKVPERRQLSQIVKIIPPLPAGFDHLKRIKDNNILVSIGEKQIDDGMKQTLEELLECQAEFHTQMIPLLRPKTVLQFEFCKKYWPVSFRKDSILESKLAENCAPDEVQKISAIFMRIEQSKGVLFYDSKNDLVVSEGRMNPDKPLCHPSIACIQSLSQKQLQSDLNDLQYLATGFDAILTEEPCTMCAMALVHCRVKRVFFGMPNQKFGAVFSRWRLQESPSINHHFEVFRIDELT